MAPAFGMACEVRRVEVDLAQVAHCVLFDELVCSSIVSRNALRLAAFVREYDCVNAFSGACIIRTATHFPPVSRTMGPWCVR
jgi:hypothetical protein